MKILAIIPARSGSKRLPGKNIKLLGGIPLISWTIRAAINSECCSDILVSTDDILIAEISKKYGASVPWLRPPELSSDIASSVDVAIHATEAYEKVNGPIDGILILQPTSPFRSSNSIRRAVELFKNNGGCHPVVSVSPASSHPSWCFRQTETGMEPFTSWSEVNKRSQDLEPAWMLNGSIYLISPTRLRKEKSFLTRDTQPITINDPTENIDIDTPDDFMQCEIALIKNSTP